MTIFAVALLSSMITGALLLVSAERRVTDSQSASVEAAAFAQAGLQSWLVNRSRTLGFTASPPAAYESTRVNLTGGYADIVMERIRPATATQRAIYVVRSTGVVTAGVLAGTPPARRTVAQYTRWNVGSLTVKSGWTSLTGLIKNGTSGTLSGADECGDSTEVAGVAVPTPPGYTQSGGGGPVPEGSPPILDLGTAAEAAAAMGIDWAAIVAGAFEPDISIPGDAWPSFADANYWPVIYVTGDFTLPGSGRGTLIVTGNFLISGGVQWDGIVLVGGGMTSNGNNTVAGATISGLNIILGETPPVGDIGNGTKTFQYNSCNVANAVANFTGLLTIPNAWMDNWSGY